MLIFWIIWRKQSMYDAFIGIPICSLLKIICSLKFKWLLYQEFQKKFHASCNAQIQYSLSLLLGNPFGQTQTSSVTLLEIRILYIFSTSTWQYVQKPLNFLSSWFHFRPLNVSNPFGNESLLPFLNFQHLQYYQHQISINSTQM